MQDLDSCKHGRPHASDTTVGCEGEDYVERLGYKLFRGDAEKAGARILKDFRTGSLGRLALELPPPSPRP
jgi:hypothetical protein